MTVLTSEQFDEAVKEGLTLVDFYADWCGPCKMLGPVVEQVAEELADQANFYKLNVDDSSDIAGRYGVMSIPTLILFKDGEEVGKIVGFQPKEALVEFVKNNA